MVKEARECAAAMRTWRAQNDGVWRGTTGRKAEPVGLAEALRLASADIDFNRDHPDYWAGLAAAAVKFATSVDAVRRADEAFQNTRFGEDSTLAEIEAALGVRES